MSTDEEIEKNKDAMKQYRQQFVSIDPTELQEEWLKFPSEYDNVQQKVSDYERMKDAAQLDLDQIKAGLWMDIKKDYTKHGFEKAPAQGDIEQALLKSKDYLRARKLVNKTTEWLTDSKNLLRTLDMKKRALEKLVDLWIANYFAVPIATKPVEGGKRITDFVYERCESKQRERINMSKQTRTEQKSKTLKSLKGKGVDKVAAEMLESEDKADTKERNKRFGVKPRSKTKKIVRRRK